MSADLRLPRTSYRSGGSRAAGSGEGVSWRVIALAGRAEAVRLCRSPLVLAGLAAAAALIWWNSRTMVPQWWVWDVQIGSILLAVAGPVLVTAHLAAGRVRRDHASALYDSYPATASARSAAHLLGVAGPVALAAVLTGAAVIWLDLHGPVGAPRPAVLAQGILLVVLAGVLGVALGTCLAHPMAGTVAVIVLGLAEADLLLPFTAPVQLPGGTAWLLPWTQPAVLPWLPGPSPAIPPATHLAWLTALIALAVIAVLWRPASRPPKTTALIAVAAAGCLALAGWSGWAQIRPDTAAQASLAFQATHPGEAERCTSLRHVTYCAYPAAGRDVARWAAVADNVLGELPRYPAGVLTIRQVVDVNLYTAPLYGGYPGSADSQISRLDSEVGAFVQAEAYDPHLVPGSSGPPVYVDINWGAGSTAGSYQLGLALQAAWWVAGLPTTLLGSVSYGCGPDCSGLAQISCLPVGQAREAIALWLAAAATPAARPALLSGVQYTIGASKVRGTWISSYGGSAGAGYQAALHFTGQGAVLAKAMLRLPRSRVEAALAARWPGWLSPAATDAQLARALGIPLPAAPPPVRSAADRNQPADPVCR